ncbi:hypothetical protein JY97_09050, partial [Alkalispirochaeta odontotermitis]
MLHMKKPDIRLDFKTYNAGVSALITIAILAGLILINLLINELELEADLTPKKLYSLSTQTETLLERLEKPVEILVLSTPGEESESLIKTLERYDNSSRYIDVRVLDPDRNPGRITRFTNEVSLISKGAVVVDSNDFFRVINPEDFYDFTYDQLGRQQIIAQKIEQQISAAIAYVSSGSTQKIYEIKGHQENPLAESGYTEILKRANFELGEISLILSAIPDDAALLTLIGPKLDISEAEATKLNSYLENGGKLFVALDLTYNPMPNTSGLLRKWDIEVLPGLVMEFQKNRLIAEFSDNPFIFSPTVLNHESLVPLIQGKLDPVFRGSMGYRRTQAQQKHLEYASLLASSDVSRLRTELTSEASSSATPISSDLQGPVDVAVAVRERDSGNHTSEGARLVVLGSASSLAGLGFLGPIRANTDLVTNLLSWITNNDSSVLIPSKSLYRLPLQISMVNGVVYSTITTIVIPLLCLGIGLVIHFHRRNR